ncbi:MAG: restriction endonuclease [Candidatus Pacebacteria bacterium]|nr:restriction endonuclease [Candidatus Paceibacterota bacterium]
MVVKAKQKKGVEIIKGDGQREVFSKKKLLRSLRRSGASPAVAERVASEVESSLHDGMQTRDIYRRAFQLLRKKDTLLPVAHKYNLRKAIMELGPDGFAFEKFVGEIFKALGFKVRVGVMIDGWCIDHEVDVSAKKDGVHNLIECKFHNTTGYKTDLKVALYVRERFQDIEKKNEHDTPEKTREHEGWLVTNTKLTTKAIRYSECVGTHVIGWGYPKKGQDNLEDLIERSGIYPVTILTSLSKQQKKILMQDGVITCRQIYKNRQPLLAAGINENKIALIIKEIEILWHHLG